MLSQMSMVSKGKGGTLRDYADAGDTDNLQPTTDPMNLILKLVQQQQTSSTKARERPRPPPGGSGWSSTTHCAQEEWSPPPMVEPEPLTVHQSSGSLLELGVIQTDAQLYVLPEKLKDGREKLHSVLRMPKVLPTCDDEQQSTSHTFNIVMVDVSVSMSGYWKDVVQCWNLYVAPYLRGRTSLYVFSNQVFFQRSGTLLEQGDFYSGATDLVGALQTIVSEVYKCKETFVKVFLITDGDHSLSQKKADDVIEKMRFPAGKVCDVSVLGVGSEFPVRHSIGLRSRLHNGSSNLPFLFAANNVEDIKDQMIAIGQNARCYGQGIRLSKEGSSLPGTTLKDIFQPEEWVYFPCEPEQVQQLTLSYGSTQGTLILQPRAMGLTNLNDMFHQWNSRIIQLCRNGEAVPPDVTSFKERLFNTQVRTLQKSQTYSVSDRLARKKLAILEADFRADVNKMESILTKSFQNEQDLADKVLCTTVGGRKYTSRVFKLKGHTDNDFAKDQDEFMKVYNVQKGEVLKLETPPEDCCRVTMTSTISDLQDTNFSELFELGKFEFLKQFTMTGIPVFAPTRDSMSVNPWSYCIKAMLNSPYTIMSQVALESFAEVKSAGNVHKDVQIKWDEADTRFNAIIPVFPATAAKIMAPFVHTRLYAMCATFAILKDPHIIDFQVHMAALGVTWVYIMCKYPTLPRPEFMASRIVNIEATAALYLNQPSYARYWRALLDNTAEALMTETTLELDKKILRCETLVKPMFILYLNQKNGNVQDATAVARIVRMILVEFVGRCLTNYKTKDKRATPFTDFFASTITERDQKEEWLQTQALEAKKKLLASAGNLLEKFYTLEEVKKAAKRMASEYSRNGDSLKLDLTMKVNFEKVEKLWNVASAGAVSWVGLQTFAREVGLPQPVIQDLFSQQSVFVYTAHALQHRASRVRLASPLADYQGSLALVTKEIVKENYRVVKERVGGEVCPAVEAAWLEAYAAAHWEVVTPLSRQEIVAQARRKGVAVEESTFDQVYKRYRPGVGLLGNACQSQACPFYLHPSRRYNQHGSVQRRTQGAAFPHAFHRVAYENRGKGYMAALTDFRCGGLTKAGEPLDLNIYSKLKDLIKRLQRLYTEGFHVK